MTEREPTGHDKETLSTYENHKAVIAPNEGHALDATGEEERRDRLSQNRVSLGSRRSEKVHKDEEAGHHITGNQALDVEKNGEQDEPSSAAENDDIDDANIVWWEGPDDPENPMNWSKWKKVVNVTIVSCICFVTPLASCNIAQPTLSACCTNVLPQPCLHLVSPNS